MDEQRKRQMQAQTPANAENPPSIASRCAVFAKSDLIHRQQEGHTREAMWSGLCQGLASTLLQTLFKGRPVEGPVLVVGGVSRNRDVVRWIGRLSGAEVDVMPDGRGHFATALGAALAVRDLWLAWNGGADVAAAWGRFSERHKQLAEHGLAWGKRLSGNDLALNLLDFSRQVA